jgi:hypothetical protein
MRSPDRQQPDMFSYVSLEEWVPADHPIRKLRVLIDAILGDLDAELAAHYSSTGASSIPPERLLRASLLQGFVELNIDDPVLDHSTFSFNRDRLFEREKQKTPREAGLFMNWQQPSLTCRRRP